MENLRSKALELIGQKVELNPLVMAVIDYEFELMEKSKINNTPYFQYYSPEELLRIFVKRFATTVTLLLKADPLNQSLTFRGISIADYMHTRDSLLLQVVQLTNQD